MGPAGYPHLPSAHGNHGGPRWRGDGSGLWPPTWSSVQTSAPAPRVGLQHPFTRPVAGSTTAVWPAPHLQAEGVQRAEHRPAPGSWAPQPEWSVSPLFQPHPEQPFFPAAPGEKRLPSNGPKAMEEVLALQQECSPWRGEQTGGTSGNGWGWSLSPDRRLWPPATEADPNPYHSPWLGCCWARPPPPGSPGSRVSSVAATRRAPSWGPGVSRPRPTAWGVVSSGQGSGGWAWRGAGEVPSQSQ